MDNSTMELKNSEGVTARFVVIFKPSKMHKAKTKRLQFFII